MTTKQEQIDQLLASLPDDARPPFKLRLGAGESIIHGNAVLRRSWPSRQEGWVPQVVVEKVQPAYPFEIGPKLASMPQVLEFPDLAMEDEAVAERLAWALAYQTWWTEARGIQAALETLTKQVEKWPKRKRR